jgi:hypothetical protein
MKIRLRMSENGMGIFLASYTFFFFENGIGYWEYK